MSMNDIVNCIPSKDLREFLTNHPISLSTLQKTTIVSEFASRRQKIRLLTKLGEETEDESEKILLSTAIDEIKKFGYTGEATNEVYKTLFPHKGFPIYPFLEVCNLPVLYKEGDLLIFRRHHFLVAGGPELRENACDFTDECYYCYDLSVKTKSEEDMFKNHEHIHVCEAESAPIDRLSRHEKRNMEYVKEVIRSHLEERKTLGLYDRLKMEVCSTEDEGGY